MVVDTPAALEANEMPELIRGADKILVPVLPSDIDIHACSRCVQNLLLVAKVQRDDNRLGIIANRVRRNTLIYQSLTRFLGTLDIPIVATLRDSQNYVRVGRDRLWAGGDEGQSGGGGSGPSGSRCSNGWNRRPTTGAQAWCERRLDRPRPALGGSTAQGLLVVLPVDAHLVRPALVVRPGVEIARDRGMTRAGALHVLEPARIGFGSALGATVGPRVSIDLRQFGFAHVGSGPPCAAA